MAALESDRPFIVTDEDYRRYPKRFAPFVNTVRQALLENTLCLIGFSGNDHNFLQWVGWIHDNLGHQNSPKMYLVGLLRPSDSQKKLLERRNIVSVDMSEYPTSKPLITTKHWILYRLPQLQKGKIQEARLARRRPHQQC